MTNTMKRVEAPELLACPFCGDEAVLSPATETDEPEPEDREAISWAVGCSCSAFVGPWSTESEAEAAWNTRRTPTNLARALEQSLPIMWRNLESGDERMLKENIACLWFELKNGRAPTGLAEIRLGWDAIALATFKGVPTHD